MAISAVSSAGGSNLQLFRLRQSEGPGRAAAASPASRLDKVQAAAELVGREDAEGPRSESSGKADEPPGEPHEVAALDPRRPESILAAPLPGRRSETQALDRGKPSEKDVRSRLDDLLGEKSALERRQAQQSGQRSAEVVEMLSQLKSRDSEVRAHEAAHMAAGGRYITGGATYSYQRGPDGGEYAVGGEVGIDTSPVPGHPEETVQKMRIVRAAALAPSEPSGADLAVAAAAAQMEAEALSELAQSQSEATSGAASGASGAAGAASGAAYGRQARFASLAYEGSPVTGTPLDVLA